MAKPVSALCKLRENLSGLSTSNDDVFAAMVRRIDDALVRREEELQWLIDASKGGNVRGVTEDRRFVWMDELREVRDAIAAKPFYGAQCPSYPHCRGGCGLGCTHSIEKARAAERGICA